MRWMSSRVAFFVPLRDEISARVYDDVINRHHRRRKASIRHSSLRLDDIQMVSEKKLNVHTIISLQMPNLANKSFALHRRTTEMDALLLCLLDPLQLLRADRP